MDSIIFPIIIILGVLAGIGVGVKILLNRINKGPNGKQIKNTEALLKRINKRLAQNPRDPEALFALADMYFTQESWDKALRTYEILQDLPIENPKMDMFLVHLRYGSCALQVGQPDAAYKGFNQAWTLRQDNFEVNYNMGNLEFQQKNYEKSVQFFFLARRENPDHAPTLRSLGAAFFKLLKYKEAMAFARKALELAPQDKESLYILGECYYEMGNSEQALKIFTHLRTNPERGPRSALLSGIINMGQHQLDQAFDDFEFGLKHQTIDTDTRFELQYQMSIAAIKLNEIGKAVTILKVLHTEEPDYKDVSILLKQYEELNSSKNLRIFTIGLSADFVALCRKIVFSYHSKSKTKIMNVVMNKNEWVDITAGVETIKWSDIIIFRFIRGQGSIGELVVRDIHFRLKEMKAGKGICVTVGAFSEEARRFTEARLIDLVEKEQLLPILKTLDAKIAVPPLL